MSVTDINYDKLLRWMLPVKLRTPKSLAWLKALSAPVWNRLYPEFKGWESKCWYDLKYQSGQVAYLEFVLNQRFDPTQHRIYIGPGANVNHIIYLYLDSEQHPLYLYTDAENKPLYLYTDAELAGTGGGYDFTINVPAILGISPGSGAEKGLMALADRYKRDGKQYIINYF